MKLPYKFRKLNLNVDINRIREELDALGKDAWFRHGFHETGHDVVALLSTGGTLVNESGTFNNSLLPPFSPTAHLAKMPYTARFLHSFGTPPHRTRFALMHPGQRILPHRDLHPNWYNKVRVHIPIQTHENVNVHIWEENDVLMPQDRTDVHMAAGYGWVFDTWRVHAVTNFSDIPRVHLIIDMEPRGTLFESMFEGVDLESLRQTLGFEYPAEYATDLDTLEWLTGGDLEAGKRLWNTRISEKNPQIGRYVHSEKFWEL